MLDKAISIVAQAFEGKFDKGGQPYILHCLDVMYQMPDDDVDARIIAVGHDLFEDCPEWTPKRFLNEGFTNDQTAGIVVVTHLPNEPYEDYIKRVYLSPVCNYAPRRVKKADLKHNSNITRMKGLRAKDFARLEKYHKAYIYLSE